ncbi:MAG TPA: hypothetical protein QGF58_08775 [Myxococcota bacterium]|nr:hypothetical protein [Myxococcota bacterium]
MTDERLRLLRELLALTREQVEAARQLDGAHLAELNTLRADRSFELQVALQEGVPEELRAEIAADAATLRMLEIRLERIAGSVVNILDAARPAPRTRTYGRRGRMAG